MKSLTTALMVGLVNGQIDSANYDAMIFTFGVGLGVLFGYSIWGRT